MITKTNNNSKSEGKLIGVIETERQFFKTQIKEFSDRIGERINGRNNDVEDKFNEILEDIRIYYDFFDNRQKQKINDGLIKNIDGVLNKFYKNCENSDDIRTIEGGVDIVDEGLDFIKNVYFDEYINTHLDDNKIKEINMKIAKDQESETDLKYLVRNEEF